MSGTAHGTASSAEIAKFDRMAARWWDPEGPMAPLHRMHPCRMGWIVAGLARAHGRDPEAAEPLAGLRILDVGCGAGLVAESLAQAGADVTGLDAAAEALAVARAHARSMGLGIDYREGTPEALLEAGILPFDAVTALEVVEHVTDRAAFLRALARLVRPGGQVVLSTLNRTIRSLLTAKIAAEYLLRWLPPGTHDWRGFVRPAELGAECRAAGLHVRRIAGMGLDPAGGWRITRDVNVNYILLAERC
jgi:2-polyprenyl-6-hydroxyphenyl methylase / 3-demethylubiquinone-9 3-methyltransferase